VVAWAQRNPNNSSQRINELFLLSGPDYSLYSPKASLTWPSDNSFSSFPEIYFAGPMFFSSGKEQMARVPPFEEYPIARAKARSQ